jgi:purine-binding chemotaxis protein CheW
LKAGPKPRRSLYSKMDVWQQLIVFSLDGQRFGLTLGAVERVERAVEITPIPRMPDNVLGVVNLRGQIIPVFNMRRRFRFPEREIDPSDQLIFARTQTRPVALLVDAVTVVIEPDVQDVRPATDIFPNLDGIDALVKGPDGLVLIHDLDRFLSHGEDNALAEALKHS